MEKRPAVSTDRLTTSSPKRELWMESVLDIWGDGVAVEVAVDSLARDTTSSKKDGPLSLISNQGSASCSPMLRAHPTPKDKTSVSASPSEQAFGFPLCNSSR